MVCRNYNYGNTKIQDTFGSPELIVNPAVAQKKSVTRTSLSSAIDPNTLPIPQGQPKEFGKLIVKEDSNSFQVGLLYLVYYHYLPLYFVCVCVGCSHWIYSNFFPIQVMVDVSHFRISEISVKTADRNITVNGIIFVVSLYHANVLITYFIWTARHEKRMDQHPGYIYLEWVMWIFVVLQFTWWFLVFVKILSSSYHSKRS